MPASTKVNTRSATGQCYRDTLLFRQAERIPNVEQGPMGPKLIDQWRAQGLPADTTINEFFGIEQAVYWYGFPGDGMFDPIPGVSGQGVLEQDDEKQVVRDCWGRISHVYTSGSKADDNAHRIVRSGIESRADWEALRGHFRVDEPMRYPGGNRSGRAPVWAPNLLAPPGLYYGQWQSWEEMERARVQGLLMQFAPPSMMGGLKEALGFENMCIQMFIDRGLLHEINRSRTDLALGMMERLYARMPFDICHFWEDIAFRNGPMLSPGDARDLALGSYHEIIAAHKRLGGGELVSVDCDGDFRLLIPVWLEAGVNLLWPLEVRANIDVVELRREYGRSFGMVGGYDKMVLFEGREAIDREFDRISPVVAGGGFVPTLDHHIPYDVPFEHFCYYMERKKQLLGIS